MKGAKHMHMPFERSEYIERQNKLMQNIPSSSVVFIPTNDVSYRSNDVSYPFRPNSYFLYLCGWEESEGILVFTKDSDEYNDILATEYFISYCSPCKNHLYGFLRLRINDFTNENVVYDEFSNYAFIRELHVYGNKTVVGSKTKGVQHLGLGKKLVKQAEWIALKNGYSDICITSGIGVREYYKNKLGYHLEGMYMKKNIVYPLLIKLGFVVGFISICIALYNLY